MVTRYKQRPFTSGPKMVATPRTAQAASTFNGIYMRPNLNNGGTVPSGGPLCQCPDIWPNGTQPIANFQTALATTQSYQTQSPSTIAVLASNNLYVRGANGASTDQSVNVTLYYANSALIQHPSYWENNIIPTDQGNSSANITNLAPGAIGVADQTFVWQNASPPSGSGHCCLIAQFNGASNSNPLPDPGTQLDMSQLLLNNLGWGWLNVSFVVPPSGFASWEFSTSLSVPANFPSATNYDILVSPVGYTGWSVGFQCSQTDSNNNPITLNKTPITGDGQNYGKTCYLEPGYNALLTIYLYNDNNVPAQPGASVPIKMYYPTTSQTEYLEAVRLGLVDWAATRNVVGVTPQPVIPLGQVTGKAIPTS